MTDKKNTITFRWPDQTFSVRLDKEVVKRRSTVSPTYKMVVEEIKKP